MIPLTQAYYDHIRAERDRLNKLREEVVLRLSAAREQGDLSENGAYKYAKFELGNIGRQLRTLNYLIHNGEVVPVLHNGQAGFGNEVTIKNETQTLTFRLLSEYEADPSKNRLSLKSPVGLAVIGKRAGDQIEVELPVGKVHYTIMEIV